MSLEIVLCETLVAADNSLHHAIIAMLHARLIRSAAPPQVVAPLQQLRATVAAVTAMTTIGTNLSTTFSNVAASL